MEMVVNYHWTFALASIEKNSVQSKERCEMIDHNDCTIVTCKKVAGAGIFYLRP
jgi:hypothetical protein